MTNEELIQYISARQFAVIATIGEGYPESACIEFGNDALTLIFDTNRDSRKFKNLQKSPKVSLVIGLFAVEGVGLVGGWWPGRGRGLPRMEVLTPPIWKTSTCLTLPVMQASPALT